MKKHAKKLTLHRETVRQLSQKETVQVAGGGITNATICVQTCTCSQIRCIGTNGCT
ncbi:MAG TPA: class I lanthipeptide [Thermoanaerobaculia bacterium]|jgi:hypothetical protein